MKKQTKNKMISKAILCIHLVACCLFTFTSEYSFSQGAAINTTGVSADPSAMLDVVSSNRGVLIPRMTEAQRNAIVNPAFGLQILNTTTNCFNFWIGSTWKQICGDCDFNSPIPGNNGPICEGSTLNLTVIAISGATYQWSGPNGFTSTIQNPSIPSATSATSGSYSVTATKNGCTCQPQSTVAIVNVTPPTPGSISGPAYACQNSTGNVYSISVVLGASLYTWTVPSGATITAGQGTTSITVTFGASFGNITVTASNLYCTSSASSKTVTQSVCATGGTITNIGGYNIHTFTTSGTFTPSGNGNVELLVVAGGGAGGGLGNNGGGGGAGGLIYATSVAVTIGSYPIIVGAGGSYGGANSNGGNGSNSSALSYLAFGGGGGGSWQSNNAQNGGSGGGGGAATTVYSGGTGISGQGNAGGSGQNGQIGGGGGGAGAVGTSGTLGGTGGNGLQYSISGTATYYAGGGGGGNGGIGASGGLGGGGNGGSNNSTAATPGAVNTGGGGGGSTGGGGGNCFAGAGGSGIVIIRYPN